MKFLSTFPKGKVKLVLELTERNQLSVTAESKALFAKLHQQGVLFALDDFGTGYATHSYLQSFLSITSNSTKGLYKWSAWMKSPGI